MMSKRKKRRRTRGGASHPCVCSMRAVTRELDTRRQGPGVTRLRRCEQCGATFRTEERRARRAS